MAVIVEQQLIYAIERICKLDSDLPEDDLGKHLKGFQITLRKINNHLQCSKITDFDPKEFICRSIVSGIKVFMAGSDEDETDLRNKATKPVPLTLAIPIIVELGLERKFVLTMLDQDNDTIFDFLLLLNQITYNDRACQGLRLLIEFWLVFLKPELCSQLWNQDSLIAQTTQFKVMQNLIKIASEATNSLLQASGSFASLNICSLAPGIKDSGMNFLNVKKKLMLQGEALQSGSNFTEPVELFSSVAYSKDCAKDDVGTDATFLAEAKGQQSRFLSNSHGQLEDAETKDSTTHQNALKTIENDYYLDAVGSPLALPVLMPFFQHIYPDVLAAIKGILITIIANTSDDDPVHSEADQTLQIVETILSSVCSTSSSFVDHLSLSELLSLVPSGDLSVLRSLENRELSTDERKEVLDVLRKCEPSLTTQQIFVWCLEKLGAVQNYVEAGTGTGTYEFWREVVKVLLSALPIGDVNQVLSENIKSCYPGHSLFWTKTPVEYNIERNKFLADLRSLLNRTTKDDTCNISLISHFALQAPFDVMYMIIKRGTSSLSEAALCIQILDAIWGLPTLHLKDDPNIPVVIFILQQLCMEDKSVKIDATVNIAFGLMESRKQGIEIFEKVLDILVLPNLIQRRTQELFYLAVGIFEKLSLLDEEKLTDSIPNFAVNIKKLCACLISCLNLVMNNFKMNDCQAILKRSTKRMERVLATALKKRKQQWNPIFMLFDKAVDLQNCWYTLYLVNVLQAIGKEDCILLPTELSLFFHQDNESNGTKTDVPQLLAILLKITCINEEFGVKLSKNITCIEEMTLSDVTLAVSETLLFAEEDDMNGILKVVYYFLTFFSNKELFRLLPRWMPKSESNYTSPLFEKAVAASVMAHATAALELKMKYTENIMFSDLLRRFALAIKAAFCDDKNVGKADEESCLFTLAVLQQTFFVINCFKGDTETGQALCLDLVNYYLSLVKGNKLKEKQLSLCVSLHNLLKQITLENVKSLIVQRITSFACTL